MSKNFSDSRPAHDKDRREMNRTEEDRSRQQGERPRQRGSMASMQAGQKFVSDEDIVKGRTRQ
jgi:hypothetical protein